MIFALFWSTTQTWIVGILVSLVVLWLVKSRRKQRHLPPGPTPLPLVGNLLQLRNVVAFRQFKEWSKTYGPVLSVYIGPALLVIVNSTEAAMEVLVKRSADFSNRPKLPSTDVISDGGRSIAFGQYGPTWKLHRRLSSKALRQYLKGEELEKRIRKPLSHALDLMEKQTEPYDPATYVGFIVANIMYGVCFGESYQFDDPDFKRLLKALDRFNELTASGFFWEDVITGLRNFPTKKFRSLDKLINEFSDLFETKYQNHQANFDQENIRDFTDFLILAKMEADIEDDGELLDQLSDRHLLQTLSDIFFAGIGTSRFSMRSVILYMVAFPEVQMKVQEELDSVLDKDELPGIQHLPKLVYTEAVLHETMRMATVAPLGVPHKTSCDTKIGDYDIPKGTHVFINHWALHNDQDKWSDVDEFRPERYLDADGKLGPKPESWLPFSAGYRGCLGEPVAKPGLHLIFASLMHWFSWKMPEGLKPDMNLVENMGACFPKPQTYVTRRRH